jgi:hypothetical protein
MSADHSGALRPRGGGPMAGPAMIWSLLRNMHLSTIISVYMLEDFSRKDLTERLPRHRPQVESHRQAASTPRATTTCSLD